MTEVLNNLAADDLLPLALTDSPDAPVLAIRTTLPVSPRDAWPWLIRPDLLQRWSPSVPDRVLDSVGAATAFETEGGETVDGEVTSVDPPHELVQRWGTSLLRWTLAPDETDETGSVLVLEHKLGPGESGQASMMAAGWHLCLAVLRRNLAGHPVDRVVGEDALLYGWPELNDRYARLLNP